MPDGRKCSAGNAVRQVGDGWRNTDAAACQHWRPRCSAPTDTVVRGRSDTGELSLLAWREPGRERRMLASVQCRSLMPRVRHHLYDGITDWEFVTYTVSKSVKIQEFYRFFTIRSNSQKFVSTPWVKKTRHQTLGYNFTNYYPIFKIFSLSNSVVNLQQIHV